MTTNDQKLGYLNSQQETRKLLAHELNVHRFYFATYGTATDRELEAMIALRGKDSIRDYACWITVKQNNLISASKLNKSMICN